MQIVWNYSKMPSTSKFAYENILFCERDHCQIFDRKLQDLVPTKHNAIPNELLPTIMNFGIKLVPAKHNAILNEGLLSISHNYEVTYVAHLLLYLVRIC